MKFIDYVDQKKNNGFDAWLDKKYGPKIEEADITELQTWETDSINLIKEIQEKSGNWYDESTYQSMDNRISTYLANADSWREKYSGNRKITSYIDSVAETLSKAKTVVSDGYKTYSQFKNADDYKAALKQWQEYYDAWGHYADNKDFSKHSGYVSTELDNWWDKAWSQYSMGYGDLTYEYINNQDGIRDEINSKNRAFRSDTKAGSTFAKKHYDYMTTDEVSIYNYLYATKGKDDAQKFLDSIGETLEARANGKTIENVAKFANEHPVISSVLSIGTSLGSGFEYIEDVLDYGADKITGKDARLGTNELALITNTVRGTVAEQVDWEIGTWDAFDFLYNTTMSGADSLAARLVFGNLGGVALGLSAAAQGTNDALARGMSDGQAFWNGLFSGVFEGLFETISIGKFNKLKEVAPDSIKTIFKNLGKSMLVNASEETLTEIANIGYDTLINGEFANYTWEELKNGAWKDAVLQVVEAGASGALMGVGMGSVGNTMGYAKGSSNANKVYGSNPGALVGEALEINPDNAFAQKMQGRLDTGKQLSGGQLMKLNNQVVKGDVQSIQAAATQRLTELGETGDVDAIAAALAKRFSGQELTRKESQIIQNSQYGRRVSSEMNPENIRSGGYSSEWAEQIDTHRINVQEYSRFLKAAQQPREATETTGEQVTAETQNEVQAVQTAAVETPTATVRENRTVEDGATGKESLQVAEKSPATEETEAKTITLEDASKKYGAQAKAMIHTYTAGQDVAKYDAAYQIAYDMGRSGVSFEYVKGSQSVSYLTDSQKELAYEAGKAASNTEVKNLDAKNKASANGKTDRRKGTVKGEGVTIADLKKTFNDTQGKAYKYLSTVAEVTGIDIVLYRSEVDADGKFQGAQGRYSRSEPGTIYIDLNAGLSDINSADDLAKYAMLRTFAHEFTHFIEKWNPIQYNEFRKVVFDTLAQRGENVNDLIEDKQARNPGMSYDKASREVVAESMTDILPDSSFVQELAENHKTIFQKLLDQLKEFVANLRDYFNSIGYNSSKEANALKEQVGETMKYLDSIVEMFDKIAVQAVGNYQKSAATEDMEQYQSRDYSHDNKLEDNTDGSRKEETREDFLRRADEALLAVNERGALAWGYRPSISGQSSERAKATGEELTKLGVPFVVHAYLETNHDGITIIETGDAITIPGVPVFVSNNTGADPVETAGHEAFHYWGMATERQTYIEVVISNIKFSSEAFISYQNNRIGKKYFKEDVELYSEEWEYLMEEVVAYVTGDIHAGDVTGEVHAFLNDYDAVKSAWDVLVEARVKKDGTQNQDRTETLTDRDILDIAEKRGITETLSAGQVSTLQSFNRKNVEVGELLKQKAKQEKKLKDLQGAEKPDRQEIIKTQNRIKTIEGQIKRESAKLREYETMDSVKGVLEKVKPMVEQRLIQERKEELAKYGTIPQGEKAVRESNLPQSTDGKNKVSKTARTVYEAGVTPEDFAELIDKEVYLKNNLTYLPVKNNAATKEAMEYIQQEGWVAARYRWSADVRRGVTNAKMSAMGALLLNNAAKAGDRTAWLEILADYRLMGTRAAQATQALRILKTLAPTDTLYMVEKSVEKMVRDLHLEGEVEIDKDLLKAYNAAQTDKQRNAILTEIQKNIAKQLPSTMTEMWTALRYVNMLGNFKTQIRNVLGNVTMMLTNRIKNTIATGLEALVYKVSKGNFKRTKSLRVGKDLLRACKADFAEIESLALDGGKYADAATSRLEKGIRDEKRVFKAPNFVKNERTKKIVDTILTPMEKYRQVTTWAMEQGDLLFSRSAYARALGGYLKANGVKNADLSKCDEALLDEARMYAIKEAQEVTFRDHNALTEILTSKLEERSGIAKVVNKATQGIMPFRQTPANVLLRAEEYSPLGFVNALVLSLQAAVGKSNLTQKKGLVGEFAKSGQNITGAQLINSFAKSLTGTGLFLAGMILSNLGVAIGGADEDEKEEAFDKLHGKQNFSLKICGVYYTLDWLSPSAIPFFMGVNLMEQVYENGRSAEAIKDALMSLTEPMLQMSMLQGLNDTLDEVRYSANSPLLQLGENALFSYAVQGMTNSLLSQLERGFEDKRFTTYVDKNSSVDTDLQKKLGKNSAKIPGWDYNQIPYINAWGEEEENPGTLANLAYNMFSPGYFSKDSTDDVAKELYHLNEVNEEDRGVFPKIPEKTATFTDSKGTKHKDYDLSPEEYVALAKAQGQTQRRIVEALFRSQGYQVLTDEQKVKAVHKAYDYAREYAQIEVLDRDGFSAKWMAGIEGKEAQTIIQRVLEK